MKCHCVYCVKLDNIEREIEDAIANDEIYAATIPVPLSTATWLEFKEYEVFVFASIFFRKLAG